VYHTRAVEALPAEAVEALQAGQIDWAVFASSSSARNLAGLLGDEAGRLAAVRCASIGPVTSAALGELGWPIAVEAETASVAALAAAVVRASPTPASG